MGQLGVERTEINADRIGRWWFGERTLPSVSHPAHKHETAAAHAARRIAGTIIILRDDALRRQQFGLAAAASAIRRFECLQFVSRLLALR
jgi:hypothetical protein